jgi:hypothetical protein
MAEMGFVIGIVNSRDIDGTIMSKTWAQKWAQSITNGFPLLIDTRIPVPPTPDPRDPGRPRSDPNPLGPLAVLVPNNNLPPASSRLESKEGESRQLHEPNQHSQSHERRYAGDDGSQERGGGTVASKRPRPQFPTLLPRHRTDVAVADGREQVATGRKRHACCGLFFLER